MKIILEVWNYIGGMELYYEDIKLMYKNEIN